MSKGARFGSCGECVFLAFTDPTVDDAGHTRIRKEPP